MIRVGIVAAVIIIIAASVLFGFRKAAREHAPTSVGSGSTQRRTAAGTPLEEARPSRKIDKESRKLLLAHIEEARAKRLATSGTPSGTSGSAVPGLPPPELSPDYILTQLRAVTPLLQECYTIARQANRSLAGTLLVSFTIDGEPDVGGVIGESEVDTRNSTITDPGMIECVRETMYALELVAPPDGGRYKVKNRFEFTPEPSGSSAR